MKKIMLILISVLIIVGVVYILSVKLSTPATSNIVNTNSKTVSLPVKTVDVQMTENGFNPTSVTIHKGDTVNFINNDSSPHWPASNPHPTHTDYPGFDSLRPVAPGKSYSFQFERDGNFSFHDHLDPSFGGTVVVQ